MTRIGRASQKKIPDVQQCEDRALMTLVFVFNGNGFGDAKPTILTANAAQVLRQAGHQAVQLSNPAFGNPAAFEGLVHQVQSLSHGQPIGLVGFSAGGTLALHLANVPALHVIDVFNDYGPPDVRDYLAFHRGDQFAQFVLGHGHFTAAGINLLSGPGHTSAHLVSAFGLSDRNIVAPESTASFQRDFPGGQVYDYNGPHGVSISASPPALADFLSHL